MKRNFLLILYLILFGISCSNNKRMQTKNSPLVTVIKLHAAEFLMDFDEAKNYIDIKSAYGDKNLTDSLSPEQAWREMVLFMYDSIDKKLTRQFRYYDYDVIETIANNKAEVFFKP